MELLVDSQKQLASEYIFGHSNISLTDISAQLLSNKGKPEFIAICSAATFREDSSHLSTQTFSGMHCVVVHSKDATKVLQNSGTLAPFEHALHVIDSKNAWRNLVKESLSIASERYAVIVRPDGHVWNILKL